MKKTITAIITSLYAFAMTVFTSVTAYAMSPSTGNVEKSTYIIILVVAGIILIGAGVVGIVFKKKK
ncbi:MAG: hypothetical protein LIO69_01305 [Oscillospiraceae bacterium]|nr:hypothetical protein [Oscillospiraceae bacterium]